MATLAGQFAGIVHFSVAAESASALMSALKGLEAQGLSVVVASGTADHALAADTRALKLELVGLDRPGIVRDLSRAIADLGVSIEELETELSSAAMSGEHLFTARALLRVPANVRSAELRRVLEGIANELMVDLTLDEGRTG